MILQNQLFAEKVQRVLIIVPETLQHQWLVEMLRRFNLHFALLMKNVATILILMPLIRLQLKA